MLTLVAAQRDPQSRVIAMGNGPLSHIMGKAQVVAPVNP
jgi:hypothetical protein